jgi:DNA-binding transcriptional LysR family regulator
VAHRLQAQAVSAVTWPGVEIRLLVALKSVADAGSFSRAARELGYTQSAVSGQITALERAVGARLIDRVRGARHLELTREGGILLGHAEAITARLAAAQADLESLRGAPHLRSAG